MNLQIIKHANGLMVDSREVAEMVGKPHDQLMRSIRTYIEYMESAKMQSQEFFIESTYTNIQNKEQPCYLITKKGCDMVANKMTGEKGVLFTATYVTKFEEMEKSLSTPKQIISSEAQILRAEAMCLNAKTRQAKFIIDIATKFQSRLSDESVQLLVGESTKLLTGQRLLPFPIIETTYSATDIANELGVSAYKVGKTANDNNLKTDEYGIKILDKAKYSDKNVPNFRYNELGRSKLKELLKED